MSKKDIIYLVSIVILIVIGLFGFIHYKSILSDLNDKNLSLSNENDKISNELKVVKNELDQMKLRQKDTHLIYTMLKESYFKPQLSNSSLVALAILLNDREVCKDVSGNDVELCNDVFDGRCDKYEYPNREICANLNTMIDRKVTPDELISHCNNKNLIEDDLAQTHCFQHFARITKNANLCDEICKAPINNTNCRANCRDNNNELMPCQDLYIKECVDYVLNGE